MVHPLHTSYLSTAQGHADAPFLRVRGSTATRELLFADPQAEGEWVRDAARGGNPHSVRLRRRRCRRAAAAAVRQLVCLAVGLPARQEPPPRPPPSARLSADPTHPLPGALSGEDSAARPAGSRAGRAVRPVSHASRSPRGLWGTADRPPPDPGEDGAVR